MQQKEERGSGAPPINYEKVFVEKVYVKMNAPKEPEDRTSGQELLHGYLCDIYRLRDRSVEFAQAIDSLCLKWSVTYTSK